MSFIERRIIWSEVKLRSEPEARGASDNNKTKNRRRQNIKYYVFCHVRHGGRVVETHTHVDPQTHTSAGIWSQHVNVDEAEGVPAHILTKCKTSFLGR